MQIRECSFCLSIACLVSLREDVLFPLSFFFFLLAMSNGLSAAVSPVSVIYVRTYESVKRSLLIRQPFNSPGTRLDRAAKWLVEFGVKGLRPMENSISRQGGSTGLFDEETPWPSGSLLWVRSYTGIVFPYA